MASEDIRYRLWVMFISCLNYTTLFIVPALLIKKSVGALKNHSQKIVVFGILFSMYLLFIFYNLMKEQSQLAHTRDTYFLFNISGIFSPGVQFNFISKIGVGIISMLSGFSIVYLPFEFFRYYDPLITQINKSKIEDDMAAIIEEIKNDKMELAQLALESEKEEPLAQQGSMISSLLNGFFGKKMNKFEKTIEKRKKAIKLNQMILNSLFIDYNEINKEERNFELTKQNKLWSCLEKTMAIVLLVYGCYKILTTVFYLLLGRNKPTDPISLTLKMSAT